MSSPYSGATPVGSTPGQDPYAQANYTVSPDEAYGAHSGTLGTPTTAEGRPDVEGTSVGQLFGELAKDLSTLMRQEVALAKAEVTQSASNAGKGIGMLAGAGITGLLMVLFLSWTLLWLLDNWMARELAALIVAALWAVVTAVLVSIGRKNLREANPQLPQTQQSLKEDAAWARAQKS